MKQSKNFKKMGRISVLLALIVTSVVAPSFVANAAVSATVPPVSGTDFNGKLYADRYPDVKAAFGYDVGLLWRHYQNNGKAEGRVATVNGLGALFDPAYYLAGNPDLQIVFGENPDVQALFAHYQKYGVEEGRSGTAYFNAKEYREKYPDIAEAFGNNWAAIADHYATLGLSEYRDGGSDYNLGAYLEKYPELGEKIGTEPELLFTYAETIGKTEGRYLIEETPAPAAGSPVVTPDVTEPQPVPDVHMGIELVVQKNPGDGSLILICVGVLKINNEVYDPKYGNEDDWYWPVWSIEWYVDGVPYPDTVEAEVSPITSIVSAAKVPDYFLGKSVYAVVTTIDKNGNEIASITTLPKDIQTTRTDDSGTVTDPGA